MELKRFASIVIKRLWIVILLPLLFGSSAAYVSFYMLSPLYESSTTLYVNNSTSINNPGIPVDYTGLLAADYLVKDYRELVKSRVVTDAVIKDMKLKKMDPQTLAALISVNSKNETRIIEISVQNQDPKLAMNIANNVSAVFMEKVKELMKVENVNIVDAAQLPASPIEPSPFRNITIAAFLGIAIALGIIFMVEYLDNTIKTPEDIEKYIGITVLGTIPVMNLK
jgi:capsular polysaccharide biosynthesis protein